LALIIGHWHTAAVFRFSLFFSSFSPRGGRKIKRENDVHLRQLAKKSTYVPFFIFYISFSAFLGVSRRGEFENTRKKIEYVSKKNHRGNIFLIFFLGDFFNFFSFRFFLLRWLSASR
jgi:hypothetical protein